MTNRLVIANWKMNGDLAFAKALVSSLPSTSNVQTVLVPPAVYAHHLVELSEGTYEVGLQNVGRYEFGAHTGELSADMARDVGATVVLVGHSERRADHSEDDVAVAAKCQQILSAGLMPVICVGETLAEREAGNAVDRVRQQVIAQEDCLRQAQRVAIAYEPIWAIGTGKSATAAEAVHMHEAIRGALEEIVPEAAVAVRILYGGSVNASNAEELFAYPEIQGVLVGGASLDTEQFAAIIRAAES